MAAVVVGCGQGSGRAAAVRQFREANTEASTNDAACVVDGLLERYEPAEVELQLDSARPDAAFKEDQFREMFRCGFGVDVEALLIDQLLAAGVEEQEAPCVAERLMTSLADDEFDALLAGTVTDDFRARFAEAMTGCGAATG